MDIITTSFSLQFHALSASHSLSSGGRGPPLQGMREMTAEPVRLDLDRLDERLAPWASLGQAPPPRGGWVRALRQALGMTSPQLAHRLSISRQAVVDLEVREASGKITIAALSRAAEALDCDLVYAIVPRHGLRQMVKRQAKLQAERELRSDAGVASPDLSPGELKRQIKERAKRIRSRGKRGLWDFRP
jgi:predicted DNA-binding mobile mystery protein A